MPPPNKYDPADIPVWPSLSDKWTKEKCSENLGEKDNKAIISALNELTQASLRFQKDAINEAGALEHMGANKSMNSSSYEPEIISIYGKPCEGTIKEGEKVLKMLKPLEKKNKKIPPFIKYMQDFLKKWNPNVKTAAFPKKLRENMEWYYEKSQIDVRCHQLLDDNPKIVIHEAIYNKDPLRMKVLAFLGSDYKGAHEFLAAYAANKDPFKLYEDFVISKRLPIHLVNIAGNRSVGTVLHKGVYDKNDKEGLQLFIDALEKISVQNVTEGLKDAITKWWKEEKKKFQ